MSHHWFRCPQMLAAVNMAQVVFVVHVLKLAVDLERNFAWTGTAWEYWKTMMLLEGWLMLVLQDEYILLACVLLVLMQQSCSAVAKLAETAAAEAAGAEAASGAASIPDRPYLR